MAEHVAVTSKGGGGDEAAELMARAMALHAKYPLFDGHNDLPWALHDGFAHITDPALGGPDLRQELKGQTYDKIRHRCLHTDIPRLRRGGAGAQFWSVYIPTTVVGDAAVQKTLEQIDCVHKLCERYPEAFEFAWTAADVLRIHAAGKVASVCGLEGGHHINNSLATLRMYHRLGCRYMTLTHNGGPGWAKPAVDSAGRWVLGGVARCAPDSPSAAGAPPLTRFGAAVVREMERIGMIVDLSHVHQETMRAVLALARSPVMFSHSSSQALCAHPRDVPDDVLEVVVANGGVVLINFNAPFIAGDFWVKGGKVGADLQDVCDHIDHVCRVTGSTKHVGLGADYDGILAPARGLEDVEAVPALTVELLRRGYTDEQVGDVLGLNAQRVLAACEANAAAFQAAGELAAEVTPATFDEDHSAGNYDPAEVEDPVKVPPATAGGAAPL